MKRSIPLLAPAPWRLTRGRGQFRPDGRTIFVHSDLEGGIGPVLRRLKQLFRQYLGRSARMTSGANATVWLRCCNGARVREQGYRLRVEPRRIEIEASSAVGFWYAVQTLGQLLATGSRRPACVEIEDHPDFPTRGVMLDVSRCKVPTMATLRGIVDFLASLKINHLQLYTEHTFAYAGHRVAWRGCSPMTAAQVRRLDRYCRARFIELVPNQNSLGHMERWLRHPRYARLAEAVGPWRTPWGETRSTRTTLNPLDRGSLALVSSLYRELLPKFSSRLLNVGCDEPFELGQGRSREECRRRGTGAVYLEYVLRLRRRVRGHGRRMMMWADIIANHVETLRRLPRDVILLEWGYEADHPFDRRCARYRRAGFDFFVCPGTSSWCSFGGRTSNALANLRAAAEAGVRQGARGYLITDWGDYGHRQYWPASLPAITYGAAIAWNLGGNRRLDVSRAASVFAFGDRHGRVAADWMAAGDVHERGGLRLRNQTVLFRCMQARFDDPRGVAGLRDSAVARMRQTLRMLRRRAARASGPDKLARAELMLTLDVLHHACLRAAAMLGRESGRDVRAEVRHLSADMGRIIVAHRRLWLARNRAGGLSESAAYYRRNLREYDEFLRTNRRGHARSIVRK